MGGTIICYVLSSANYVMRIIFVLRFVYNANFLSHGRCLVGCFQFSIPAMRRALHFTCIFFSQSLSDAKEINCLNIPWALKGSILPAGWWQAVADGLKLTIARAKTGAL